MQVTLGPNANNGPNVKPVLIITRPAPDGDRFASEVAAQSDVRIIISPLQKIVPVDAVCGAGAVIFTSGNGVAQAVRMGLAGERAWCVGDRTAQLAQDAGFNAMSAGGNAEDLIKLILAQKPLESLTHIRGREARGDIALRLIAAGIPCVDLIAYEQEPLPLSDPAKAALEGENLTLIPLFSPRAAILLLKQVNVGLGAQFIVMSKAVADELTGAQVQVLDAPNGEAMLTAVIGACRNLPSL